MALSDDLDDEAVARLLAEDARASSSRYASQGLSALLPKRANGGAPKPNTRFLKNLVRDADAHNTALRRKEEQERRERLRHIDKRLHLDGISDRGGKRHRDGGSERKRRRLDTRANEGEHSTRWREDQSHKDRRNTSSDRSVSPSRSHSRERQRLKRYSHRQGEASDDRDDHRRAHRKQHTRRSRSPRQPVEGTRESTRNAKPRATHRRKTSQSPTRSDVSSDPLEDIVGPLPAAKQERSPPLRSRGRGAYKPSGSVMDSHFSAGYDPSLDVHPDSEDSAERDDWDMALEALRDRQQWHQKQADRMREAGFDDDEIKKWEDSGKEKSAGDVKWRKAGEGREWDVGKPDPTSDENTQRSSRKTDLDLEASWKRKSGGLLRDLKRSAR